MTKEITWPLYLNGQIGKVDQNLLICYNYKIQLHSRVNMKETTKEITQDLRSYRFIGEEAESLGGRLDSARVALESAKSSWSKKYWAMVIDQLLFQWRSLPALHDGAASMSIIPRWSVDYEFYDSGSEVEGYTFTDKIFDEIFRTSLDESWDRVREARLAKAQY
jgi:hypothetical protein